MELQPSHLTDDALGDLGERLPQNALANIYEHLFPNHSPADSVNRTTSQIEISSKIMYQTCANNVQQQHICYDYADSYIEMLDSVKTLALSLVNTAS